MQTGEINSIFLISPIYCTADNCRIGLPDIGHVIGCIPGYGCTDSKSQLFGSLACYRIIAVIFIFCAVRIIIRYSIASHALSIFTWQLIMNSNLILRLICYRYINIIMLYLSGHRFNIWLVALDRR